MTRRGFVALGLALAIAAAVVLVIVLTGRDEGSGETLRGLPDRGLSLRGSLAGDDGALEGAVDAWRDQEDSVAGDDEDVTALWIGRAGDGDVAILATFFHYAEVTRAGDGGDWTVRAVRPRGGYSDWAAPIGVGDSVLVPDAGEWRYVPVGGTTAPREVDGLFRSPRGRGFVLTAQDGAPPGAILEIYATGVGRLSLGSDDFPRLLRIFDRGRQDLLWQAVRTADPPLDRIPAPARYSRQYLALPWTGTTPGGGDGVVVAVYRGGSAALALGHTIEGGAAAGSLLGTGHATLTDHVAAADEVELSGASYLVVAGEDARTLTIRIGADRLSRRGPVAFVDTGRWRSAGTLPKVTVAGRTNDGAPLTPLP